MQKTLYYSVIQTAVCYSVTNKCTHFIRIIMMWTHTNIKAAPITVQISISVLTLMNLQQFYILAMIEGLDDYFIQLCTPWWLASKAHDTKRFAY